MTKTIVIGVLVALTLLFGFAMYSGAVSFGAGTATGPQHRQIEQFIAGIQIGPQGSTFQELKGALCTLARADTSIAASSTGYAYCTGVTGLAAGDVVFGQLSTTSSGTLFGGWTITSAKASTTPGAVDFRLMNSTGAAAVPSATGVSSSSVNVWYADI